MATGNHTLHQKEVVYAESLVVNGNTITGTEIGYLDGITAGTFAASKAMVLDSGGDGTMPSGGIFTFQTAHSGLLHGAGASGTEHALGDTADNAMEYYLEGTHTTGDMRGLYLRLYFAGAGGSGEAARIFSTVDGVTAATGGTVNGAHISLSLAGAAAAISGAGNALRCTLGIGTGVTAPGGTQAVIQVDSDIASGVTPPTGIAFLRFTNSGNVAIPNLMRIPDAANGTIFAAHTTQTMTHSIRILNASGTAYYVMVTDAATNRS